MGSSYLLCWWRDVGNFWFLISDFWFLISDFWFLISDFWWPSLSKLSRTWRPLATARYATVSGNAKKSVADRRRFFDIAYASLKESVVAINLSGAKCPMALVLADHIGGSLYKLSRGGWGRKKRRGYSSPAKVIMSVLFLKLFLRD